MVINSISEVNDLFSNKLSLSFIAGLTLGKGSFYRGSTLYYGLSQAKRGEAEGLARIHFQRVANLRFRRKSNYACLVESAALYRYLQQAIAGGSKVPPEVMTDARHAKMFFTGLFHADGRCGFKKGSGPEVRLELRRNQAHLGVLLQALLYIHFGILASVSTRTAGACTLTISHRQDLLKVLDRRLLMPSHLKKIYSSLKSKPRLRNKSVEIEKYEQILAELESGSSPAKIASARIGVPRSTIESWRKGVVPFRAQSYARAINAARVHGINSEISFVRAYARGAKKIKKKAVGE